MNKRNITPWIVAGIVVVGAGIAVFALKKGKDNKSILPDSNGTEPTPQPPPTTNAGSNTSSPIGKNAYVGKTGLIVRSSPELSDGFLGLWSNNVGAVNKVDTLLGVVQGMESDKDMDKNPLTSKPYVWYRIKKDPALKLLSADNYFVREDYTTLK